MLFILFPETVWRCGDRVNISKILAEVTEGIITETAVVNQYLRNCYVGCLQCYE